MAAIPTRVDMVDVFRQSRFLPDIVDQSVEAGAAVIWTQLRVIDETALGRAEQQGLEVVMDRCPAIEGPRLVAAGLLADGGFDRLQD